MVYTKPIQRSFPGAAQIALALGVNFVLFIIIPALHNLFGQLVVPQNEQLEERRVVTEIVQPKKEDPKPVSKRIRNVETNTRRSAGSSISMKFTPDLDVAGAGGVAMETQDLAAVIFEEGEVDEKPIPVYTPLIPYPQRAVELNVEGTLELEIQISHEGKVESIIVLKSPHPSISSAARRTVANWRFKPGKNKGIPVRVRAIKPIEFKLDSDDGR